MLSTCPASPDAESCARLAHHRVEAVANGTVAVRRSGRGDERFGVGDRCRQRLLADDMLARREHGGCLLGVQRVRRAHMHDVDAVVGQQLFEGVVRPLETERVGRREPTSRGVEDDHPDQVAPGRREPPGSALRP